MTDSAQKCFWWFNKFWIGPRWNQSSCAANIRNWICAGIAVEVGGLLELRLRDKNLQYHIDMVDWAHVEGDWGRIREVLVNLVGNSIKFTDNGGSIKVSFNRKDQYLITSVTDNGCGISEEKAAQLFQPFSKGVNRPWEESNTGLGLWICRSVIELHQGYIWVESKQGQGTVLSFALPIQPNPSVQQDIDS